MSCHAPDELGSLETEVLLIPLVCTCAHTHMHDINKITELLHYYYMVVAIITHFLLFTPAAFTQYFPRKDTYTF